MKRTLVSHLGLLRRPEYRLVHSVMRCRALAVGLAFVLAGCGTHRITSSPSGATVYRLADQRGLWRGAEGGWGVAPEPWEMHEVTAEHTTMFDKSETGDWKTPITIGGGPGASWYQVTKPGYQDSGIVYFPSMPFTGETTHHFQLSPERAAPGAARDRSSSTADVQRDPANAIVQALRIRENWAIVTDIEVRPKVLSFTKWSFIHLRSGNVLTRLKFRQRVSLSYGEVGYVDEQQISCPRGGIGHRVRVFQSGPKCLTREVTAIDIRKPNQTETHSVNLQVNPTIFFFPPEHTIEKENFLIALRTLCPNLMESPMIETKDAYQFPDRSRE